MEFIYIIILRWLHSVTACWCWCFWWLAKHCVNCMFSRVSHWNLRVIHKQFMSAFATSKSDYESQANFVNFGNLCEINFFKTDIIFSFAFNVNHLLFVETHAINHIEQNELCPTMTRKTTFKQCRNICGEWELYSMPTHANEAVLINDRWSSKQWSLFWFYDLSFTLYLHCWQFICWIIHC